ncbi:MAG: hypothetical protein DDT37_00809 [Firmicutes bacterium]|nr:hypothetical protein [candidate division NPL-UPA2 bacterium]
MFAEVVAAYLGGAAPDSAAGFAGDARMLTELPKLWPAINRPGRFIDLHGSADERSVVCMNSGSTPVSFSAVFTLSPAKVATQ